MRVQPIALWSFSDWVALTKARANIAVVATTFVGFALHAPILPHWALLLHTLAGTTLLAAAASVANQTIEKEFDASMERTRNRPIAAGRIGRRAGARLSALLCGVGNVWLASFVNLPATGLADLAFLTYVFAYTPLKRRSPTCTLVGAVSGALPLLVGWEATGAPFGPWASIPFAILFLWQIPHFLAIAWWRRSQYLGAGYQVLPQRDHKGYRTAGCALLFTLAVVAVSLLPVSMNRVTDGYWYWQGSLAAGLMFCIAAVRFWVRRDAASARSLFLASLWYLPAVYALMLLYGKR